MDIYQYRRDRLLSLIESDYGGERVSFCNRTGLSESRLAQILSPTFRNGTAFTEKTARKMEQLAGLPAMYFDQGAAPASHDDLELPHGHYQRVEIATGNNPNVVLIPKVRLKLRAGVTGFHIEGDNGIDTHALDLQWLKREKLSPEQLVAIRVTGESMEPKLHDGDLVVVNTADRKPMDGHVYAINYEGEAVIKRLSRDAGSWWLTSDNPDQQKYHRKSVRGNECIIVGRIVKLETTHI